MPALLRSPNVKGHGVTGRNGSRSARDLAAPPAERVWESAVCRMDACAAAVPRARDFTRDRLETWQVSPAVAESACLVVSELTTNALLHSGSPDFELVLTLGGTCLRLEVADAGTWCESAGQADGELAEHGRGMILVEAIASDHGRRTTDVGTRVWATLPADPPAAAEAS